MILQEILEKKRVRLEERKSRIPIRLLEEKSGPPERDFLEALRSQTHALIAEFKRSSPSSGKMSSLDLRETVGLYSEYAQAISILTEEDHFGGSLEDLSIAAQESPIPVLRKDFIIDPYEIYESRYHGADALLLIAEALTESELAHLYALTRKLSMHALIEVHHSESLDKVLPLAPPIIGINNRNLEDLTIDRSRTAALSRRIPAGTLIVSESGFLQASHIEEVKPYVGAFLIGTAFMNAGDPEAMLAGLKKALAGSEM